MAETWQTVWLLRLHVVSYAIGTLSMLLAFLSGSLLIAQDYRLKQKRGAVSRLPSLQALDLWMLRFMLIGFPLLTLGLLLGLVLAHFAWHQSWLTQPKVFFALLGWVWYALLLQMRLVFGWRGRRLAILNMISFAIVLIAWFSVYQMVHNGVLK